MPKDKHSIVTKTPDDKILIVEIPDTREKFIEYRNQFNKRRRSSSIGLALFGLVSLLLAMNIWIKGSENSGQGYTIAIFIGVLVASLGIYYLRINSLNPKGRLLSNDFTDEELASYNRKFRRTWSKGFTNMNLYPFMALLVIISLMAKMESMREFIMLLLSSGLSVFMLVTASINFYEISKTQ